MNIFSLIDLITIATSLLLGVFILAKDKPDRLSRIFLFNCVLIAYIAFCEYVKRSSEDVQTAFLWQQAEFLWPFISLSFLGFALNLTEQKTPAGRILLYIFILPAVFVAFLHLFTDKIFEGGIREWYGWEFPFKRNIYTGISPVYSALTGSMYFILVAKYYNRLTDKVKKKQTTLAILGLAVFYISGFVVEVVLPQFGLPRIPLASSTSILSILLLSVSLLRLKSAAAFSPDPDFKYVLNGMNDFLVLLNHNGEVIYVSKSLLSSLGYKETEMLGRSFDSFLLDNENSAGFSLFDTTETELKLNLKKANNSVIAVSFAKSVSYDKISGESSYLLLGTQPDIKKHFEDDLPSIHLEYEDSIEDRTSELADAYFSLQEEMNERINVENALRESESRYRNFFETVPIGIYQISTDDKILMANSLLLEMLDYSSFTELQEAQSAKSVFSTESPREAFKSLLYSQGVVTGYESVWLKKDGTRIYCRENANAKKDSHGEIIYFEGTVENITAQKLAETALKKSEERYRMLIDTSYEGVIMLDKDDTIIFVNSRMEGIFEAKRSEILGKKMTDFLFREDLAEYQKRVELRKKGIKESFERRMRRKDGKAVWTITSESSFWDEDNNYQGSFAMLTDITSRKVAEESLKEKDYWLLESQRVANLGSYIMNVKDGRWETSELLDTILGISQNYDRNFDSWIQLVHPDHRGKIKVYYSRLISSKERFQIDYKIIRHSDNSVRWVHGTGDIDYDKYDNPVRMYGIIQDITERKKAEEALKESEQRLKNLTEVTFEGIIFSENEVVVDANEQMAQMLHTSRNNIIRKSLSAFMTPEAVAFTRNMNSAKDQGLAEQWITREDWTKFLSELRIRLIDTNGRRLKVIICRDITERKKAEEEINKYRLHLEELIKERTAELEKVNRLLQEEIVKQKNSEEKVKSALIKEHELNELKTRFISVASHEFRTPLTSILASADFLQSYGKSVDEEKYNQYVTHIQTAGVHLSELIKDLLTVSTSDTDKVQFSPVQTDLFELSRCILESTKLSAPGNIEFCYNYCIDEKSFSLDTKLITQILSNLLSNAVKYSPLEGGKVTLSVEKQDGMLILSVEDEGIGISPEDQRHLFEPFHRGENARSVPGTGLGLSIVQKSAGIHNGKCYVESKLHKGTKVTVMLDYKKVDGYEI